MMRRFLIAILAVCLIITGTFFDRKMASAATDTRYIRVRLTSYGTLSSTTMKINGSYYIREAPGIPLNRGTVVGFSVSNGKLLLSVNGTRITMGTSVTLKRCSSASSSNWITLTSPAGYNYPGDMTVSVNSSSLQLVVRVFMEDYLMGVLPYEMSNSFPLEALKAQAVAARTYAVANVSGTGTYDVVDTSANQVYRGYNTAYSRCAQAIRETSGQILLWKGAVSDGVYSASNGGQINPRCPRWGKFNTYHTIKDDPYDLANISSPSYTFLFPATLDTATPMDPRIEALVKKMLVTAAKEQGITVSASQITILGFDDVQLHTLPAATANGATDPISYEYQKAALTVRCTLLDNNYTLTGNISTADLKASCSGDTGTLAYHRVFYREVSDDGKYFRIIARGYGHGIGMSQRGAQEMANQGFSVMQILDFYYGGCIIGNNGTIGDTLASIPERGNTQYVTTTAVNLTYTPGGSVTAAGGSLAANTTVEAVLVSGSYTLVFNETSGAIGYLSTSKLQQATLNPDNLPIIAQGQVMVNSLYVRSNASANSAILGVVNLDHMLQIVELGDWCKIIFGGGYGYVNATYIRILSTEPTPTFTALPEATLGDIQRTGIVNATLLNVRSGPGTGYTSIGRLPNGTVVTIIEIGNQWLKIIFEDSTGYVSAAYILLDPIVETAIPSLTATITPSATPASTQVWTGTIHATALNYRTGPSTKYPIKGTLPNGTKLTILALGDWYKIAYANGEYFVNASYVTLDTPPTATPSPTQPMITTTPSPVQTTATATPVVTQTPAATCQGKVTATHLYYRTGPGTQYPSKGTLVKGTIVTVLETGQWLKVLINNTPCYVSGNYVEILTNTPIFTASTSGKGIITANSLYVRSQASTSGKVLGTLHRNDAVTILTTGSTWHTIEYKGSIAYISAKYVRITAPVITMTATPAATSAPTATLQATATADKKQYQGIVRARRLNYREGPSTASAVIGTLTKDTRVTILETGNTWHKISLNDEVYYVSATYIQLIEII